MIRSMVWALRRRAGVRRRDFQRQNSRKPWRCQRRRVAGCTIWRMDFQLGPRGRAAAIRDDRAKRDGASWFDGAGPPVAGGGRRFRRGHWARRRGRSASVPVRGGAGGLGHAPEEPMGGAGQVVPNALGEMGEAAQHNCHDFSHMKLVGQVRLSVIPPKCVRNKGGGSM